MLSKIKDYISELESDSLLIVLPQVLIAFCVSAFVLYCLFSLDGMVINSSDEEDINVEVVEVNDNLYQLNNYSSNFVISASTIEVDSIELDNDSYSIIMYDNNVLLFKEGVWYQYVSMN